MQIPPGSASFQARCHVHAVAKDVAFLDNDIAEVDPEAELDPLIGRDGGVAIGHPPLDLNGAAHGVHNTRKLRQQAVASVLYYSAPVPLDLRRDQLGEVHLQPFVRPLLVRPHKPRIARHVGGEDRGETADGSHHSFQPALRRPSSICS